MSDDIDYLSSDKTKEDLLNEILEYRLKFNSTFNDTSIESLRQEFNELILNLTELKKDPGFIHNSYLENTLIIIFYSLIIIVSLFGNLLVCKVIISKPVLRRRTTNVLIMNLTISDLLMTILAIPVTVIRLILDNWPFGSFLCIFEPLIQVTSIYVSALSMAVIALDRYQVLIHPMGTRICNKVPKYIIIGVIWITGFTLSVPHSIFNRSVELYGFDRIYRCRTVYPVPQRFYQKVFTLTTALTQVLIPLLVTLFTYALIGWRIYRKSNIGEITEQQMNQRISSKQKTIKMLSIVVIIFAVCWLPINSFHIMNHFFYFKNKSPFGFNTFIVCHWLAFSSVCWNPFIYFGLNSYYRQELRKFFLRKNYLKNTNSLAMNTRSSALLSKTNSRISETKFNICSTLDRDSNKKCVNPLLLNKK